MSEIPRRRVLFIAYAYPPVLASGSIRSVAFSTNLRMFGWEPTVLTVERCRDTSLAIGERIPDGVPIVRCPELNLHGTVEFLHGATRRALRLFGIDLKRNWYRELLCVPDPQIAWLSWWRGIALARSHDLVYVSCSPFSSALVGCAIKICSGKPLVLDFRDAWSLNPHTNRSGIHRAAVTILERAVLKQCDRLIVNTPGAKALYSKQYPHFASKITTIPNGYDALNQASASSRGGMFTIMHVGNFYGSRAPDDLLQVLSEISHDQIEFVQVGAPYKPLKNYPNVNVRVVPRIQHEEALRMMRTASVLYLKQGFEKGITDYIAVAAKTYEYISTGLPILADCPAGDNIDLIRNYAAHSEVVTSGSKEDLKAAVLRLHASRNQVTPFVKTSFIDTFDRVRLTERLASLFDDAISSAVSSSPKANN